MIARDAFSKSSSPPEGNANVTTNYDYDVGNRLVRVSTSADGTTQVRTFVYDNLGNLRSETHPEKVGAVTYSGFDSRGHAHGKVDGESDLAFTYDRAERVTDVDEGSGLRRPLKEFEYSTTVAAGDWRKGKLRRAKRYNYYLVEPPPHPDVIFADDFECGNLSVWNGGPPCPPPALITFDVEVEETYVYGGTGGRVSSKVLWALHVGDRGVISIENDYIWTDHFDICLSNSLTAVMCFLLWERTASQAV